MVRSKFYFIPSTLIVFTGLCIFGLRLFEIMPKGNSLFDWDGGLFPQMEIKRLLQPNLSRWLASSHVPETDSLLLSNVNSWEREKLLFWIVLRTIIIYESWRFQLSKVSADAMRFRPWWSYSRNVSMTTDPVPSGGISSTDTGGREKANGFCKVEVKCLCL